MIGQAKTLTAFACGVLLNLIPCSSFHTHSICARTRDFSINSSSPSSIPDSSSAPSLTDLNSKAIRLKDDLIAIAASTRRGFSASKNDREKVNKIVNELSMYSPSDQPAAAYYSEGSRDSTNVNNGASLAGKWTLIYTDAPDITSLDGGPLSTAKLGKIGQECSPPYIKNVIEWKKPDWAMSLPFTGSESSRILQKVCCEASSNPANPKEVDLKLVGLEISGSNDNNVSENGSDLSNKILNGPAGLLEGSPINLRGPLTAPFGKFEILYLDYEMRITRTFQGFTAVNIREDTWF